MRNLLLKSYEETFNLRGGYFAPINSTKTSNGSCVVGVLTSEGASIQHPFSIRSVSVQHPMQSGGTQVKSSFRLLRYAASVLILLCLGVGNAWGTASTSSDSKSISGTVTFDGVGTISNTTCYWYNGVKFFENATGSTSVGTQAWSTAVTYPCYAANIVTGKDGTAKNNKWGNSDGNTPVWSMSGLVLQRHCLAVHVNSAGTITLIINNNTNTDVDVIPNLVAKIDDVAYGTAYTTDNYLTGTGDALTLSSSRADATNKKCRYTVTYTVSESDLTDGEAVVKFYYGSSGTGAGKLFCYESVSFTPTPSCTAPNHVDVTPTSEAGNYGWRYSIGETLKLTATPYSSAGTGSPITSGITGYQWQKYVGSKWTDLEDDTYISGATTANLQISNLTTSNGGSYRCNISTGATCTTSSDGYFVRIFTLYGGYSGGSYSNQPIVWTGEKRGTVTINLNASSSYKFKFTDNDGKWYGNGGTISKDFATEDDGTWGFGTSAGDATLSTGSYGGGDYVLTVDITHFDDGGSKYVNLRSVVYPKKTTYLQLCSDWKAATAKYAAYYWNGGSNGWTDFMETHDCDGDIRYAGIPVWATNCSFVRFNPSDETPGWNGDGHVWNQTGDLSLSSSNDYYHTVSKGGDNKYYGSWGTYSPTTYTISFAANGGSGSMSSIDGICPSANQAITANSFTAPAGYEFSHWTADVNVTVSSSTVTAGSAIADAATLQSISSDITLTAQWSPQTYSITYKDQGNAVFSGSHESGYPTSHTYNTATTLYKATKSGYAFAGWYTSSTCTGDAVSSLGATAYTDDITLYARWVELDLHQPGTYEKPEANGGYGRPLKLNSSHDYEVYLLTVDSIVTNGDSYALYAGSKNWIANGYRMFTGATSSEEIKGDGWLALKATCGGSEGRIGASGAGVLGTEFIVPVAGSANGAKDSRYAKMSDGAYIRLRVKGYDQFSFFGSDKTVDSKEFVVKIDGQTQSYTHNSSDRSVFRFTLTTNDEHFIEITGNDEDNKFRGFSLRLPDVTRYTVSAARNNDSYGSLSASSVANVRTGSTLYVDDNTFTVNGTTVTATAESGYRFENWTIGGEEVSTTATISAATTVTANFSELFTLSYDANGGTGSMSDKVGDGTVTLDANTFTKTGYIFAGWATSQANANAGTIAYADEASYTLSDDATLYAVWYKVIYEFTPATSGSDPEVNAEISSSTGGDMTYTPTDGSTTGRISYNENGLYFKTDTKSAVTVTLDAAADAGDIIEAIVYAADANKNRGVKLQNSSGTTKANFCKAASGTSRYVYTVTASDGIDDATTFKLARNNDAYLQSLKVARFVAEFELTWNFNGGGSTETAGDDYTAGGSVESGTTLVYPSDASMSRTGYAFSAWSTDATTMPASDLTITASWTANTTTVTLNPNIANHGTGSNVSVTATYDSALPSFSAAVPADGYRLTGYWTDATGGTKIINADGTFAANSGTWNRTDGSTLTLYAQYEDNVVDLPGTLDKSNVSTVSEDMGWYGSSEEYFDYGSDDLENTGRWAEWQVYIGPGTYSVSVLGTYIQNGHSWRISLINGSGSTVSSCTTDNNWHNGSDTWEDVISSWSLSSISAGEYTIRVENAMGWARPKLLSLTFTGDGTLYTVTYNANGGTCGTSSATQRAYSAPLTLPTPTRDGYTFEGWYNNGTKLGNAGASYTPTADVTAYAHWTDNIDGKLFSYEDGHYGDKYKSFDNTTWVTADQSAGKDITFTNASTGVQFEVNDAGWDSKTGIVSLFAKCFGSNKGNTGMSVVIPSTKVATVKILYGAYSTSKKLTIGGDAQTAPAAAMTDGMTTTSSICTEVTKESQTGTLTLGTSGKDDNIYIAKVSAVITGYVVTYDKGTYGTGTLVADKKTIGTSLTLSDNSTAFERDGYTYDGWSTSDGGDKVYEFGDSYTTDAAITLYPHWVSDCGAAPEAPDAFAAGSITSTGVTFTITDDETPASYDIYYSTESGTPSGSTAATITTTTKTKVVTGLTANTTYYAWVRAVCDEENKSSWVALGATSFTTLVTYTMTYNASGASGNVPVDANSPYETGSTVTVLGNVGTPSTLSKSYSDDEATFLGWNTNSNMYGGTHYDADDQFTISANTVLYAVWGYSIAFTKNGGDWSGYTPPTNYIYGQSLTLPTSSQITRAGYDFTKWYLDGDGDQTAVTQMDAEASGNATYVAVWSAKTYTVNLNGNGGTGNTSSVTATYNSSSLSSSITNPTLTGYIFGGWYSGSGGTGSLIINTSGVLQASVDGYTGAGGIWTKDATTTLYAKWTRDVKTAGWGEPWGATAIPSNTTSTVNGVTLNATGITKGSVWTKESYNLGDGDAITINLPDGYYISTVSTSSFIDTWIEEDKANTSTNRLYIQFNSESTYDDSSYDLDDPIQLADGCYDSWGTLGSATPVSVGSVPSGAQSAKIYCSGNYGSGGYLYRIIVEITAYDCTPSTVTFAAGGGTGTAPSSRIECGEMTLPGKGSLAKKGNTFTGWSDGTSTYKEGDTYDVTEDVTFTAQWSPFVVPVVTGLEIDDDYALTWSIPGKLNLSTATLSDDDNYFIKYQTPAGSQSYNAATEELTITYTAAKDYQKGVAIPFTGNNLESITYDYKGHRVFPAVVKSADETLYWEYDVVTTSADWTRVTRTPSTIYPNEGTVKPLPTAKAITFCANPNASKTDEPFYIRNVFYHCTGMIDVDHVVLMRKEGSAATDTTEAGTATRLYSGKLSHYTDETAVAGKAYYYTVFSVHADGSVSAGTTVEKAVYIVTHSATSNGSYTIKVGDASATDETTTAIYEQTVTLTATPSSGYVFDHWTTSGTSVTLGNANIAETSFTMPNGNVTVAAVFKPTPNVYYYKDATHYTGSAYKNPEGNTASGKDNVSFTNNPWTISQSVPGVTSVVVNDGTYDNKNNHVKAYIKLQTGGDEDDNNIVFTIAEGYEATISMKIGGYSSNPTVTLKPYDGESLGSDITKTTGYATVGGVATTENNFNEIRWSDLEAGDYVLNVSSLNAYISEIDIQTVLVGYAITNAEPTGGTIAITNGTSPITIAANDATVYITATPSTGYGFTSWSVTKTSGGASVSLNDDDDSDGKTRNFTMPSEAVTVNATFTEITHSVSVAAGAHGSVSTSSVSGVGIATASGNITATPATGYNFSSWTLPSGVTAADGFDSDDNPIQINATADGKTITANYTPINYTITYNLNSGTNPVSPAPKTGYNIEDEDYDLPVPTYSGHVFQGWYTDSEFTSDRVYVLASGSTGNKTYYAKWGTEVSVAWTITKVDDKLYKGGGGHTVTAVVDNASWTGSASSLVLGASDGVILGTATTSTVDSKAQIVANFDITEDVEGDAITFYLTAPANGSYGAIEASHDEDLDACPSGDECNTYVWYNTVPTGKSNTDRFTFTSAPSGSNNDSQTMTIEGTDYTCEKRSSDWNSTFTFTIGSGKTAVLYFRVKGTNTRTITITNTGTSATTTISNVGTSFATYYSESLSAGSYSVSVNGNLHVSMIALYECVSSSGVDTELEWDTDPSSDAAWDTDHLAKEVGNADFTFTASADNNSIGAVTYSSSTQSVATVNATTGKVHIVGAGSATITATLAACGCYNGNTATYDITVTSSCDDVAGTVSATDLGCKGVELTVSGHTGEGVNTTVVKWFKDGTWQNDAKYNNKETVTVTSAGEWYAETTASGGCAMSSTSVTVDEIVSSTISPTIFANEITVKQDRSAEYRLMQLGEGETITSVANTLGWTRNTQFAIDGPDANGIVSARFMLTNTDPTGNGTITLTISNECSVSENVVITIHAKAADSPKKIAWLATGTKGEKACQASQSTNTDLYQALEDAGYDMTAYNAYWTVDEAELIKEYSQYDLVILTDYPDSQKGPNSDKNRSKSYTNALGLLIDHVPMLTFEAFVAGCPNWGLSANPTNTASTQNSLTLLCNANDIFGTSGVYNAGTSVTVGDVSSGNQSLQGFALDAMPNYVFIAMITDGGTNYVTCCERQENMNARMMVFGLNANVMDAITATGQQMVIGFVDYLLKDENASIPDCSVIFTGGASGTGTDWNTASNWEGSTKPNAYASVRLDKPCVVADDVIAKAGYIKIHVSTVGDTYTGSLTINPQAAMIVENQIFRVEDDAYTNYLPTEPGDLVVEADASHTGALIFNNDNGRTQATVEMYSPSHWETEGGKKKKYWSYVGIPIQSADIPEYFYNAFTYLYDETSGWIKKGNGATLHAFEGIGLSRDAEGTETFSGALASTKTRNVTLSYTAGKGAGMNLIGNSWTAPIQIANFDADDFGDATATVYVYNTGRDDENVGEVVGASNSTTAGQWVPVPIATAKTGGYTGLKVIPAMNAFEVNTSSRTTLTLDYDKLVRGVETNLNEPMRAPRRDREPIELEAIMCVRVNGEKTHTDVWLQQDERFTNAFDNGWEATYSECDNRSAQFYAQSEIGKMAFVAVPDLEGTVLGFVPSRDGNDYLFSFHYVGDETFYLNDLKLQQSVLIDAENTYSFTYAEGDTNRFYISRTPLGSTETPTGVDGVVGDQPSVVRKLLINDHIYIIRDGKVYGIDGALVK